MTVVRERSDVALHVMRAKTKGNTMSHKIIKRPLYLLLAAVFLTAVGCITTQGPSLGILSVPVPVSPYLQTKAEDDFWVKERYERVPILGPISANGPHAALDAPSDDEVMRAFLKSHPLKSGIPFLYDVQRNDIQIVKEKIADYLDPPRFYPLIGPAQLHHAHYKCTLFFTEKTYVGWPVPHMLVDEESQEVLYIDHNHLHMVGNPDAGNVTSY